MEPEPGELDLWKDVRAALKADQALKLQNVPDIQRAVIQMMILHREAKADVAPDEDDGHEVQRSLKISLRDAAEWLQLNIDAVKKLSCDHTAVRKALQKWIDRGVMAAMGTGTRTYVLSINRIQRWFSLQVNTDEGPLFAPVSIEGVDRCRPVVTAVDCRRPLLTGGDHCRPVVTGVDPDDDRQTDDDSYGKPPQRNHHHPSVERPPTAAELHRSHLAEVIESLPPTPPELWTRGVTDELFLQTFTSWWTTSRIVEQLGDTLAADVRDALIGLIRTAKDKSKKPRVYFAQSIERRRIFASTVAGGADWWDRANTKKPAQETPAEEARTELTPEERDALERQYGALIDAADVSELLDLLGFDASNSNRKSFLRPNGEHPDGRRLKMYRTKLLRAFCALDQQTTTAEATQS